MCPGNGDIGGRWIFNEGYRWNVPTVTYAFDYTFVTYFWEQTGSPPSKKAIQILNDLPPAASITNDGRIALYSRPASPFRSPS